MRLTVRRAAPTGEPPTSRSGTEPVRTCVGCRQRGRQSTLVRLAVEDGALTLGAGKPGRGAWLCRATVAACFDAATEKGRWSRALRADIDPLSLGGIRHRLVGSTC